jgi:hypothetical protein
MSITKGTSYSTWRSFGKLVNPMLCLFADVDEQAKKEIKDILLAYDRTLLVADPRRCEPKKCALPTFCPLLSWMRTRRCACLCVILCILG